MLCTETEKIFGIVWLAAHTQATMAILANGPTQRYLKGK
jgi:hypothetical protein